MSGHTPGPWYLADNVVLPVRDAGKAWIEVEWIVDCRHAKPANAKLIATAPELLDALRWYVDNDDTTAASCNEFWQAGLDRARAIIAKATGEEPKC